MQFAKKIFSLFLVISFIFIISACGTQEENITMAKNVGIFMPTASMDRWQRDVANLKDALISKGYTVSVDYADSRELDSDSDRQIEQINEAISQGCKILIINPVNRYALDETLNSAQLKDIKIISYDRLIMNTNAISYYATFDNALIGKMQGEYILDKLDIKNNPGPFNLEIFAGDTYDNNTYYLYDAALKVLEPYIDKGVINIKSQQIKTSAVATLSWLTENAQSRMKTLIDYYNYSPTETKLDAVLCANDSIARGVINALQAAGYTKDNMPIITGQDCEPHAVKNIQDGLQTMSIFKDTRLLADSVANMVEAISKNTEPEINDTENYDNGTGKVKAYLCEPILIDSQALIKKYLIESGYYSESDIS